MTHQVFRVRTNTVGRLFLMPAPQPASIEDCMRICNRIDVSSVVSLLGEQEALDLGLGNEGAVCAEHNISFRHFPIQDFGLPDLDAFKSLVADVASQLERGTSTALHCRAGIGRTGTTASCVLQVLGHAPEVAMEIVSAARRTRIPDTAEQAEFIKRFRV